MDGMNGRVRCWVASERLLQDTGAAGGDRDGGYPGKLHVISFTHHMPTILRLVLVPALLSAGLVQAQVLPSSTSGVWALG
jgi:hypothetical protein